MNKTNRQVIVIGGGEAFDTRGDYLAYLRDVPYDPYEVRPDDWKKSLPPSVTIRSQSFPQIACRQAGLLEICEFAARHEM